MMSYLIRKLREILQKEQKEMAGIWYHHCPGDWKDFTEVPKGERCPLCNKSELGYYPKTYPPVAWEWKETLERIKGLK
jgi:hypothetical protein